MITEKINKFNFVLLSLLPITIIVGPTLSLLNILLISISFIFFVLLSKNFLFLKNKILLLLFLIYLYLIFNSLISIDINEGIFRNLGFLRFILAFLSMNYLLNHFKLSENIYKIWCLVICIVVIDTYIEFFLGKNSLGFGGSHGLRLVSFFKDEPIVGAYLSGFLFIVIIRLFESGRADSWFSLNYIFRSRYWSFGDDNFENFIFAFIITYIIIFIRNQYKKT